MSPSMANAPERVKFTVTDPPSVIFKPDTGDSSTTSNTKGEGGREGKRREMGRGEMERREVGEGGEGGEEEMRGGIFC